MKRTLLIPSFAIIAALLPVSFAADNKPSDEGFTPIFDGKTLKGWHVSTNGHSRVSGGKSGGKWEVKDGAITGTQDPPKNGGLLLTDELFGEFEVVLEMNNDFGPDSGLFLRSTEDGKCYQATDGLSCGRQSHGHLRRRTGRKTARPLFQLRRHARRDRAASRTHAERHARGCRRLEEAVAARHNGMNSAPESPAATSPR